MTEMSSSKRGQGIVSQTLVQRIGAATRAPPADAAATATGGSILLLRLSLLLL